MTGSKWEFKLFIVESLDLFPTHDGDVWLFPVNDSLGFKEGTIKGFIIKRIPGFINQVIDIFIAVASVVAAIGARISRPSGADVIHPARSKGVRVHIVNQQIKISIIQDALGHLAVL